MSLRDRVISFFGHSRLTDAAALPVEGRMPEFAGLAGWLNSPPLDRAALAGHVVLVDFWTLSCVNCLRSLPWLRSWHEAYAPHGLTVIGIHTPEFDFEKDPAAVRRAVKRHGLTYPIALDNDFALWNAYRNHYWPAHYFIDARGQIRSHHFGEGAYEHAESVIRALLAENGAQLDGVPTVRPAGTPLVAFGEIATPETYLGFDRLEYLGSPESVRSGIVQRFTAVRQPTLNVFYFEGLWEVLDDCAVAAEAGAKLTYRYRASRVNLVLAPPAGGSGQINLTLDGRIPPPELLGADAEIESGRAVVRVAEARMYELIDARHVYAEHLLEMTFETPGLSGYAFTFG